MSITMFILGMTISALQETLLFGFGESERVAYRPPGGKFIFSLDSDEWIDENGWWTLYRIGQSNPDKAYLTHLINNGVYELDQVKIFPNQSDVRYIGRVHEQIAPSIVNLGIPIVPTDINIYHDGYVDAEELYQKRMRNRKISSDWLAENPNNMWARYWHDYIHNRQ